MKKIITILFAVLMVFAACSKPSTEAQEPSEPSTEQSSMPEEPEIPEEPKEPEYEGPKHLAYLREDSLRSSHRNFVPAHHFPPQKQETHTQTTTLK